MRLARNVVAAIVAWAAVLSAQAADHTLLIQVVPGGAYKVWHSEGETQLSDDEAQTLEVSARPEGGDSVATSAGPARAFESRDGVIISIPGARSDKTLLIDRDACGGVRMWHSAGATTLTDEELTELVLAAVPGGGKRVSVRGMHAKAFSTRLGIIAVMWKPVVREP
ncbi:MAG: hypothetical protein HY778_15445 [Betaproteobacteria bacterium]|nr:hypothetical protein [Betaproteobacteria bacterium]